ncbi:MAG: UPF0236 family protein, partial [Eggerthellaceae bacterium]|nr:UPF0236 family protein [Eggerthellaceae bacterium]
MDSTTFAMLVAVAADYFYLALKTTEDFDSFLQTVRGGMREAAVEAVAECIERFDREVAAQIPRSWELKDRPSRTVVTMFGRVTYARSRYRDEHGRNRYPTDEILGIPKRKRLTTDVFLWLVARAARVSFRQTARDFADVSGVKVSAMCPWRAVQQEGPLIAADLESAPSRGISQADVFAECDGIYIALQVPERREEAIDRFLADQARERKSVELKAGCVYAGKRKEGKRGVRGNVALFATVGSAEEMRAGMRATIAADYDVADIERVHYASDGGGWCVSSGLEGMGGAFEQGLDLYHVMRYVHRAFPEGGGREHLVSLALKCRPEALAKAIDRMIPQARDAKRREKMRECRDYVANHADLLRGGGSLGTMEATNAYVWAKRMKSFGCAWSRRGAANMALALCRVCANRPLVAPPKGALFTAAEKSREAASLARRGAEAAKQLTVGRG